MAPQGTHLLKLPLLGSKYHVESKRGKEESERACVCVVSLNYTTKLNFKYTKSKK